MRSKFSNAILLVLTLSMLASAGFAAETTSVKIPAKFAYVGGFTPPVQEGTAKGLEVFAIDTDGRWSKIQTLEIDNPTYLVMDSKQRFLYSCHDGDSRMVTAYAIDPDSGTLTLLNQVEASGETGAHVTLSADDKYLLIANYMGGTVDSFAINPDGGLGRLVRTLSTGGQAGVMKNQDASHPHQCVLSPDGKFLLVPDKGRDLVHTLTFDAASGDLGYQGAMFSRPGLGTRQMDLHPTLPYAYILEELDNSLTVCEWDAAAGTLEPVQWLPLVPDTYFYKVRGENSQGGASIWVDKQGKFVYASQRGHDSIGIFAIDAETGFLAPCGWQPTGGIRPRFFTFDPSGTVIFACNQVSNTIVAFRQNPDTGLLDELGVVAETPSPGCLLFR